MRSQVPVPESEPVRLNSVGGEFFLRVPGFVRVAPALVRGLYLHLRCTYRYQDPTDPDAVHPGVVADIDDRGELGVTRRPGAGAGELAEPQQLLDTEQEPGATDAADQNRDLHIERD
jgi:hypothetical protein